nr:MAG: hypothetical protein [Molluscum contagiosum virus]
MRARGLVLQAVIQRLHHRVRAQEPEGQHLVVEVFHEEEQLLVAGGVQRAYLAFEHGQQREHGIHVHVHVHRVCARPRLAFQVLHAEPAELSVERAEPVHRFMCMHVCLIRRRRPGKEGGATAPGQTQNTCLLSRRGSALRCACSRETARLAARSR